MVLVVSPLIALMIDQVQRLRCRGVSAVILSGGSWLDKDLIAIAADLV